MARFEGLAKRYTDSNGDPLSTAVIYFYEPGTTTDKTVYQDSDLSIAHSQPVEIDADGLQPDIFFDGEAKAVLYTAPIGSGGVLVDTADPIGEAAEDSGIKDWSASATYDLNDVVKGSDGNHYQSVQGSNTNNNPTTPSPSWWMQLEWISVWNTNYTYAEDQLVTYGDKVWRSLQGSNQGNTPAVGSAYWRNLSSSLELSTTVQTGNFNAVIGTIHPIDTSGGAFTATLPASPSDGDQIGFKDVGGALSTEALTLDRSGNDIAGSTDNHELVNNNITYIFTFLDGDWRY